MAIKKLQNDYTTPEQSKRLLELGLPAYSASGYYTRKSCLGGDDWVRPRLFESDKPEDEVDFDYQYAGVKLNYPLWTCGRLMEIFDTCFIYPKSRSNWCAYTRLAGVSYVNYILDYYKNAIADKLLDFSKLEE